MIIFKTFKGFQWLDLFKFFLFGILACLHIEVTMKRFPRSNRIEFVVFWCSCLSLKIRLILCKPDCVDKVRPFDLNLIVIWILHLILCRFVHLNRFSWNLVRLNLLSFFESSIIALLILRVVLTSVWHDIECLFLFWRAATSIIGKCWLTEICCKGWIW